MDMAAALSEVETWPADEQFELIQRVWDRLAESGWQPTLSDDQRAELDRRLDDLEQNPHNVVTWDEIVDHVSRKR